MVSERARTQNSEHLVLCPTLFPQFYRLIFFPPSYILPFWSSRVAQETFCPTENVCLHLNSHQLSLLLGSCYSHFDLWFNFFVCVYWQSLQLKLAFLKFMPIRKHFEIPNHSENEQGEEVSLRIDMILTRRKWMENGFQDPT